jgi:hypothetical protein
MLSNEPSAYTFTAPTGAKAALFQRGQLQSAIDWTWLGPISAGPATVSLPLTSTLAPARLAPVGQRVSWGVTTYAEVGGSPAIDLDNFKQKLARPGALVKSGARSFRRQ